jgi:hypothetical protein
MIETKPTQDETLVYKLNTIFIILGAKQTYKTRNVIKYSNNNSLKIITSTKPHNHHHNNQKLVVFIASC